MVPNPSALRWSKLLAPSRGNGCPGRKDRQAGSPHQKPQFPFSYLSGLCISVVKFPPCSFVIVQESTSASRRHAKLGLSASRNKNARILEKQNRLQMSQVFSVSCIDDQMRVAFQGFYKRGSFTQAMLLPHGLANR